MANNGYLNNGVCVSDPAPLLFSLTCKTLPSATIMARFTNSSGDYVASRIACYYINSSGSTVYVGSKYVDLLPDCQIGVDPASIKIPTVADGITLGWQAGSALILVGCILFLKKALK